MIPQVFKNIFLTILILLAEMFSLRMKYFNVKTPNKHTFPNNVIPCQIKNEIIYLTSDSRRLHCVQTYWN